MVTDGTAEMSCLAAGTSDFTAAYFGTWYSNDGMDCYSNNQFFFDDGDTLVRPLITITTTSFDPASIKVFPNTPNTTTASVDIGASDETAFDGSLMSGDFVVVEILTQTSGETFEIKVGTQAVTTQTVTLNLGGVMPASFTIQALSGTALKNYLFTIRVSDVRRPNTPPPGSTSILNTVQLQPTTGGMQGMLQVAN